MHKYERMKLSKTTGCNRSRWNLDKFIWPIMTKERRGVRI
jgi:hypothetical protein